MLASRRQRARTLWIVLGLFFAGSTSPQGLELETTLFAGSLYRPLAVVSAGDGSGRVFLVEQSGKILIHDGTGVLPTPFLDLGTEISCCGEKGLLGLAFHPDYESNGYFFVAYTEAALNGASPPQNDLIVARYEVSSNPNLADAASELVLMDVFQPFANHNGGHLAFDEDGWLYISLGDGGSGGDPGDRGQSLNTLLGKLLRLDVDNADPGRNYSVPASNPFAGDVPAGCAESCPAGPPCGATCDEIWAFGLRNPWRFSFDRQTDDLYIGDVGQGVWEEVDFAPATSTGGENYGWRRMEGDHCYPPDPDEACIPPPGHVPPVLEYDHDTTPGCSVTGGFVYRGAALPALQGVYLYGDFCQGTVFGTVPRCDGAWEARELIDTPFRISTFGEDETGELYLADLANGSGEIHRIGLAPTSLGPALDVLPSPIDFGSSPPGTIEVTLMNSNTGPEALQISDLQLENGSDFTLDLNGGSAPCATAAPCLAPGESCTVTLVFSGTGSSWFLDRLLAPSNSAVREAGVGACTAGATLTVSGVVSGGEQIFDACETIEVVAGAEVTVGGRAIFRAGDAVSVSEGVAISGEAQFFAGLP